jgi:tight adherence protein B
MTSSAAWGSDAVLFVVLGSAFAAVFFVASFLLGSSARAKRDRNLAERIGGRGSGSDSAVEAMPTTWVPEAFAQAGQRFASATGFSAALEQRLEQAGVPILAGEFVALTAGSALVGAVVATIFLVNIIFIVLVAAVAALFPFFVVRRKQRKRKEALQEQLADTMSILATSLRAGYSFLQALDTVSKEIGEPSAHEFQRVVAEIRLGRPIDDALAAMAERIGSDDLRWAVIAINVQRQVGGNLAEVLDIVSNTVRERAYIRRQVRVLSAEGRISIAILTALPILLLVYQAIVNPDYVKLLFNTTPGLVMLIIGGALMGAGIFWMTRIVKIDV